MPFRQTAVVNPAIRLGSLSDPVPTCLKCLNGLCCGARVRRLKFRAMPTGRGERVGADEEAQRHPLGRTSSAVIVLGLHEPTLQRFAVSRADMDTSCKI